MQRMKKSLELLKTGDLVTAEVLELTSDRYLIVSFSGDLLRIRNKTGQGFRPGEKVELVVIAIEPLSFQLSHRTQVGAYQRRV